MEKWSDKDKRIEIVDTFKKKVLKDIEKILKRDLELLKNFSFSDIEDAESRTYQEFRYLTKEVSACVFMREWITKKTFMDYIRALEEKDYIVYTISSRHLRLWSQDDYDFMWMLIDKYGFDVININDRMLEYDFTNIFDEILFDEKEKKGIS